MTIWTMSAKNGDGSDAVVADFDDGGDLDALRAHQITLAATYASTNAVPQTPVIVPDPGEGA